MPTPFALLDAKLVLNSVNLSGWLTKGACKIKGDPLESQAMGATFKSRVGGLKDCDWEVEFNQDFAAGGPDATLFALVNTAVSITLKSTSGANSSTNPEYQGNAFIAEYTPIDGSVGDLAKTSATWPGSGTLTRATS